MPVIAPRKRHGVGMTRRRARQPAGEVPVTATPAKRSRRRQGEGLAVVVAAMPVELGWVVAEEEEEEVAGPRRRPSPSRIKKGEVARRRVLFVL